jgi:hypothetical protein
MQEPAEGLKVQSAASRERVGEVIKQDSRVGRWKIDLVHPTIFTARLAFDEPPVVQEPAAFDVGV